MIKTSVHRQLLVLSIGAFCCSIAAAQSVQTQSAQTQRATVLDQGPLATPLAITLQEAIDRARRVDLQYQTAVTNFALSLEDRVQARAALLPSLSYLNEYVWTQPNGTPSGVFVTNDGVHLYSSQAVVHAEVYSPEKRAEYRQALAGEAVARARKEIAGRGLVATVVESYYSAVSARRKSAYAMQSLDEAHRLLDITQKQEQGGEVAHSDVVKAQILLEQRQRETQDSDLAAERSLIALGVLVFQDYDRSFSVVDDLQAVPALPSFPEVQERATKYSPEIQAARARVEQEDFGVSAARGAGYPTLSLDYYFGINANEFAVYNSEHQRNLGSSVQATFTIPIWTWGATRSRIRQAELRLQQARVESSQAQRELLGKLNTYYSEAQVAEAQVDSLRRSADLASESLRLTLLRYEAGEVSVLEVVDAQSTLAQARNAYDDGLVRARVAIATLRTLTGEF